MLATKYNILFLCTANSARSIMAEVLLQSEASQRFNVYSAGSHPRGEIHPKAADLLKRLDHDISGTRSKSWDEFAQDDAPEMDFIITVCDRAAAEACPKMPGMPMTAHWSIPDPATVQGLEAEQHLAFAEAYRMLRNRIVAFANLSIDELDKLALQHQLDRIAAETYEKGAAE